MLVRGNGGARKQAPATNSGVQTGQAPAGMTVSHKQQMMQAPYGHFLGMPMRASNVPGTQPIMQMPNSQMFSMPVMVPMASMAMSQAQPMMPAPFGPMNGRPVMLPMAPMQILVNGVMAPMQNQIASMPSALTGTFGIPVQWHWQRVVAGVVDSMRLESALYKSLAGVDSAQHPSRPGMESALYQSRPGMESALYQSRPDMGSFLYQSRPGVRVSVNE